MKNKMLIGMIAALMLAGCSAKTEISENTETENISIASSLDGTIESGSTSEVIEEETNADKHFIE